MSRPDSPEWTRAKQAGDRAELLIADYFRTRCLEVWQSIGETSVDLLILGRVEVKADLRARETGNVAIEMEHRGRPSGLAATTADYWVHVLADDEAYMVHADALRIAVEHGDFDTLHVGDGNHALVHLIPLETFKALPTVKRLPLGREAGA